MDDIQFTLEPATSIDGVGVKWEELEIGGNASFFVSWIWIGTWLRCLPEHVRPQFLAAWRGGTTIGAAILVPRNARRHLLLRVSQLHLNSTGIPGLDCVMIEHNGFVGGPKVNRALWPAFLRWFAKYATKDFDELIVPGIVEDLDDDRPREVKLLHRVEKSPAFACAIPQGGLETILGRLSSNARQQLRRSLRDCGLLGELRCETAGSVEEALDWFGRLKTLHIESWTRRGKPHAFRYPFFETFHRALIERGVPRRSVLLLRVSAGDNRLGYLYNFRIGNRVVSYQSGFNRSMNHLRPGYVSHALAMAAIAGEGAQTYDFLAGDNRLKRSFASKSYAMHSYCFGRPRPALELEGAARSLARSARG